MGHDVISQCLTYKTENKNFMYSSNNEIIHCIEADKFEHFTIVRGKPTDLIETINRLRDDGYTLHGTMYDYIPPNSNDKIFIQAMVKYTT